MNKRKNKNLNLFIKTNYKSSYEWKNINFALDFNNKELEGLANISKIVKEILDVEEIKKIYNEEG